MIEVVLCIAATGTVSVPFTDDVTADSSSVNFEMFSVKLSAHIQLNASKFWTVPHSWTMIQGIL